MNSTAPTQKQKQPTTQSSGSGVTSTGISKEHAGSGAYTTEIVTPLTSEVVLGKELEQTGVKIQTENIEIPSDVKKLGLSQSGASTPISQTATVVLPLSDDQVAAGLHMQVYTAIRWLAEWCVRQLKRAHLAIKTVHGKIVRAPIK